MWVTPTACRDVCKSQFLDLRLISVVLHINWKDMLFMGQFLMDHLDLSCL